MISPLFSRVLALSLQIVLLQPPASVPPKEPAPVAPPQTPMMAPMAKAPATAAEKIADTRESIKQATLALEKLQKRLDDPEGEYKKAETEFEALNTKLKMLKVMVAKLRKDGDEAEAAKLEATLPGLEVDWGLAKDRFDIAIRQKQATQETIAGLKDRIESDKKLLDQLEGKGKPEPPMTTAPPMPMTTQPPPKTVAKEPAPMAPKSSAPPAEAPAPAESIPTLPGFPAPLPVTTEAAAAAPAESAPTPPDLNDPVVRQAHEHLDMNRAELKAAEARLRVAEERVRIMERSVENAQKTLNLEKEAAAQAEKAAARFATQLREIDPAKVDECDAMAAKLMEAEQRLADSRARIQRVADRIAGFNETLSGLKAERDVVVKETEDRQNQVAEAEKELNSLLSPTAPRNLFRWVYSKGPRILLIIFGMGLVHLAVRQFSRHIVRFITRNSQRGSENDRENRANTLVGVFRYVAGVGVFGGGLLMLLDEIGVPVVPLMGGAAVIGLAVAFGAQNLIRDYFTGFMMLMEDQYSVNDVVRIGNIAGLVEQITLRMTVLRDLEGVRHFIPHGTITSVSNLTHGWSRALLDVPVAYKENVDRVIEVLMQLARELRIDPVLGRHILEEPEMLGVDSLADSGVVVRFLLKTRPLQQWPIKREMLRRIKNRFDELGIEIPFPHRMVYHRFDDGTAALKIREIENAAA